MECRSSSREKLDARSRTGGEDVEVWHSRAVSGRLPLLGRAAEREVLVGALDAVRAGEFRAVVMQGEAGIGKTRLTEELVAEASAAGFAIFAGRAEELEAMRPLGAIADAVALSARTQDLRGSRLEGLVKDASRSRDPIGAIDAVVEFVEEMALSAPTCVVLEDLHWADPDTIAAARAVTRRLSHLPLMVVITHRPHPLTTELVRFVDVVLAEGGVGIDLDRLDEEALHLLAREIVGRPVGPRLATLLGATSGNPLYATELANALLEEGLLDIAGEVADTTTTTLPPTLRLTILRRLSQFPTDVIDLLKTAAVLGSSFQLHELASVAGKPVDDVAHALDGPIAAKILGERHPRLAFRHDLIHEAIYEDIPTPIRASMHVAAFGALRNLGVAPIRLAEQLIRGVELGDPSLFDAAFAVATEVRFLAPRVAVALAEKAFALGVPERRRDELRGFILWPLVITGRRADAQRLAHQMLRRRQDPTIEGMTRLVLAVVGSEDGRSRETAAAIDQLAHDIQEPPGISRLIRICRLPLLMRTGIFDRAAEMEPLMAEAREAEDHLALTIAMGSLSVARLADGRVGDSVRLAEEYMEMEQPLRSLVPTPEAAPAVAYMGADRLNDAREVIEKGIRRSSEAGEVTALAVYTAFDGLFSLLAGAWTDAEARARMTSELVAQGSSAIGLVLAHATLAQLFYRRGMIADALRSVVESERIVADKGPQWGMDLIGWTRALCLESSGRPDDALAAFLSGWETSAKGRHIFARPAFPDLVRLALAVGDEGTAQRTTEEAEEAGRLAPDVLSAVGAAVRCRGLLEEDPDMLVHAVDAYRKSPRVLEKATACEDAGRLLLRAGRTEARSFLNEAVATFDDLGAAHDSSRVLAAMRSAGIRRGARGARRRPATGWDALTPAELQVARLTVEGRTNPQIAEQLFISKYTVQTHLSNVFGKLGITSRVALAALAAEKLTTADRA